MAVKFTRTLFTDNFPWLLLFLLLFISATRDAVPMFCYPVPAGVNGYYYVLQITDTAKTGRPYFPTHTPLVLYALSLTARLTGNVVTTIKAASILLQIFLSVGIFAIIKTVLRNNWLALLAVGCAAIPQSRLYFTSEYINQLGSLVLLVWAGWTFIRTAETRSWIGFFAGLGLTIAALFSHKSALVFAATIAICVLLVLALTRSAVWKVRALLVIVVLWVSPMVIAAQPLISLPESLRAQISLRPQWPIEPGLIAEELMLAIAALAVLGFVIWSKPRTETKRLDLSLGAIALWSLLITLNPFFNTQAMLSGVAGRTRLFAYLPIALLVPGLIWFAHSMRREAAIYVGAVFLPLFVLSALGPMPYGLRTEFLARRVELIRSLETHSGELAQNSLIIAPHGDQFAVTATTGIPSQQRPAESSNDGVTYWLLNDVRDPALIGESIVLIRNGNAATVIVDSAVLKSRLSSMPDAYRLVLLRANAHLAESIQLQNRPKPE